MTKLTDFQPQVNRYLNHQLSAGNLSSEEIFFKHGPFQVAPLAQGEYNMNYLVEHENGFRWVFRVNVGSQINRDDQIDYEFKTLKHLAGSSYTPTPYFVDSSKEFFAYGVLGMNYLPGTHLQYQKDSLRAAQLFAHLHEFSMDCHDNHLIPEDKPLTMTFEECSTLLPIYFQSSLANPSVRSYLQELLAWAEQSRKKEVFFTADTIPCIINTEVNSSNFIVNPETQSIHLVDWEKPLWGDPSQDISHFCVPTTTLWKTDYRMSEKMKQQFMREYCDHLTHTHLRDTIQERVHLRDPFNCLRGISWCAMAWVKYQTGDAAIRNEDTWKKLCAYMDLQFIRSLFDPYLKES